MVRWGHPLDLPPLVGGGPDRWARFWCIFGVRLGHTLGLLVRPRVTSCDLIRPHSTSFDLVRPRSTSFDLIRPHSTSFDFIRPHSTSCDLVRPRATSCDLVRPRSTSFGVIRPHSTSRDLVRPRVTSCKLDHNFRHSARQLQVSVQAPRYQNERTGPDSLGQVVRPEFQASGRHVPVSL